MTSSYLDKPDTPQEAFAHYGIKGMKWGVRKRDDSSSRDVGVADETTKPVSPKERNQRILQNEAKFQDKLNSGPGHGLTEGQKKALYIGAGSLAALAVIGGGAYLYQKHANAGYYAAKSAKAQAYLAQQGTAKYKYWGAGFINSKSSRAEQTLPAGLQFTRFSKDDEKDWRPGTYATYKPEDADRYLGFGYGNLVEYGDKLHRLSFSTTQPVRLPSIDTTVKTTQEVLSREHGRSVSRQEAIDAYNDISGSHWATERAENLISALVSKGFHGVVDEMDAGTIGDSPVVLFPGDHLTPKTSERVKVQEVWKARKNTVPMKDPKV